MIIVGFLFKLENEKNSNKMSLFEAQIKSYKYYYIILAQMLLSLFLSDRYTIL